MGTSTFSAKRSLYPHAVDAVGTQYAVGVSVKRSTHTVDFLANIGGGDCYLLCKKVKPHVVGMQYAVDVSAKRSIHTVDLANMGGGDRYL